MTLERVPEIKGRDFLKTTQTFAEYVLKDGRKKQRKLSCGWIAHYVVDGSTQSVLVSKFKARRDYRP